MATVELVGICKSFGSAGVIQDLNVRIDEGEFMVLVGPSGSGKSTALRLIAGLERPTVGKVLIGGREVTNLAPRERDIAMVFQSYALYPHMTVFDNLAFSLRLGGTRRVKSPVRRIADGLGIDQLLRRKPRYLSGGQRQRVAVGRAIVRSPQAFLMDEPLSNLDAQLRAQTRVSLLRLHRELQTTTIYVTHDQTEAMTLGQRIAILKGGVIQQIATPHDIYHEPLNRFVAGFIGSPTMNMLRLDVRSNPTRLVGQDICIPVPDWWLTRNQLHGGEQVVLGVRPESLVDERVARLSNLPLLRGDIELVEDVGANALVHVATGTRVVIARLGRDADIPRGGSITLGLDLVSCHVFEDSDRGPRLQTPFEPVRTHAAGRG